MSFSNPGILNDSCFSSRMILVEVPVTASSLYYVLRDSWWTLSLPFSRVTFPRREEWQKDGDSVEDDNNRDTVMAADGLGGGGRRLISLMTEKEKEIERSFRSHYWLLFWAGLKLIILCTLLSRYSITFATTHRSLLAICFDFTIKERGGSFQIQIYWFSTISSQESHIFRKMNRKNKSSLKINTSMNPCCCLQEGILVICS